MTRVQIPAYTDRWMMGDRFGEIVNTYKRSIKACTAPARSWAARPRSPTSSSTSRARRCASSSPTAR